MSLGYLHVGHMSSWLPVSFLDSRAPAEADTQHEDRLKRDLLCKILGEAAVNEARHGGKGYFCAPLEDWASVLGFGPPAKEP